MPDGDTDEFEPWMFTDEEMEAEIQRASDWWLKTSPENRLKVWEAIQKTYGDVPVEVMSQMAELTFCQLARKHKAV